MEIFITSSARHSHTRNSVKIHFYCHLSSPDPPCRALCASSIHPNTNLFLAYMSQSKEVVWSLSYEFRSSSSSLRLSFDRNAPSVYKGRILKCFYPNGKFRNTCCVRREVCTIIVYIRIRSLRVKKIEKLLAEPENDQKSESIKVAQISGIIPTAIKLISLHNWLLFGYIKFAWKHFPTFPFSYFFSAHKKFLCKFRNFIHHHFFFLYRAQVSFSYRFHGWMRFSPSISTRLSHAKLARKYFRIFYQNCFACRHRWLLSHPI